MLTTLMSQCSLLIDGALFDCCIRSHVKEMGATKPSAPLLFMKPATAFVTEGNPIKIPKGCSELHHEVELAVIVSRKGFNIPANEAMDFVGGYTLALDMTARDLQAKAKQLGHPWTVAKGFDTSCPVGRFIPKEQVPDPQNLQLTCHVNNVLRQDGNTKDMIFQIPALINYISGYFTLEPGDVILTGTPAGVGAVSDGDIITATLGNLVNIEFSVIKSESK